MQSDIADSWYWGTPCFTMDYISQLSETYTYTVTDCKGNSASCSFTVTAVDNTPPVFDTIYPAVVFLECPDFTG